MEVPDGFREPRQRFTGKVTRFHAERGWGFIDLNGRDIMVHTNDCKPEDVQLFTGGQPRVGDIVTFDCEPRDGNPEHLQAKRVVGGTDERCCNTKGKGQAQPVPGTGQHYGSVKAFNTKGVGWIQCSDGSLAWVELADCVGTRPVTRDYVQFDLEPSEAQPGKMQAVNVTGGSAPMDLSKAVLSKDMAKQTCHAPSAPIMLKRNANGHLIGCVCAACAQLAPPTVPVMPTVSNPSGFPHASMPGINLLKHQIGLSASRHIPFSAMPSMVGGMGPVVTQSSRQGPYNGGLSSLGRMF
eukprot:TRINITY_DN72898_c0_g1_i1.p1 TRINITY_DN72898_c0_g1~~TRINITY_DN72898_c0_g1_i1.p1  ORF type:complete len:306 (+),score=34.38 TRINITY_DN72898_c0_g1_i1:31-918(+)